METSTVEFSPMISVGGSDLSNAIRAEVDRISKQAHGNHLAEMKIIYDKLVELEFMTEEEATISHKLVELSVKAHGNQMSAKDAYFESRDLHTKMLAGMKASPVAIAIASGIVGSYSIDRDEDGEVVITPGSKFQELGAGVGAFIGGLAGGGAAGAGFGAWLGGKVGGMVDDCLK
jgi:hypothetical protein